MIEKQFSKNLPLCSECVFHAEVEFDGKNYCVRCLQQVIMRSQKRKNQDLYAKKKK